VQYHLFKTAYSSIHFCKVISLTFFTFCTLVSERGGGVGQKSGVMYNCVKHSENSTIRRRKHQYN
jgi:hypothetical protein